MNIINQQREHILENNNIGKTELRDVLINTNKRIERLEFKESLHGDLDFSILKEYGFGLVEEIVIHKGDVTSVTNLPEGLKKFTCNHNLLFELENLPKSIEEINVNNNYIEVLELDYLKNLQVLHCSSNRIPKLEKLPTSLKELKCENSTILESLHLGNTKSLQVLHISNTSVHIIYEFPDGVTDFVMDNTPSIEFRDAETTISLNAAKKEDDEQRRKNYLDSLHEYFKMKSNYEKELSKLKRKVYKKASTKKMGRLAVLSVKPSCIKCKRPVGTTFGIKDNKHIALCGDSQNPCNLDIQIYNSFMPNFRSFFQDYNDQIEQSKQKIICDKLDGLFSYITEDESIRVFNEEINTYNQITKYYEDFLKIYNNIYDNDLTKTLIIKKNESIFKLIESIKSLLAEYKKTDNIEFLKQAVRVQYQINTEARNLRMLKYEVMEMDHRLPVVPNEKSTIVLDNECQLDIKTKKDSDVLEHILVQRPVELSKMEYLDDEPPSVIKFVI